MSTRANPQAIEEQRSILSTHSVLPQPVSYTHSSIHSQAD
jgi:hypothetical protein